MAFGVLTCTYKVIERGTRKIQETSLDINRVQIQELHEDYNYKYFRVDKSVGIYGPLNKIRVTRECKLRLKKIWNSQLNGYNNSFAVQVITATIGILNWDKIRDIDIATRKILTMPGSLHKSDDSY